MYKLPETLTQDILSFAAVAKEYEEGKIESAKFKITRVPMGIYEQRKDEVYMIRVRTTGGVIHPSQFLKLIDIAEQHHSNLLHITTRQEIQIQNLELNEVEPILKELQQIGLSSKGGGGNTIRNILVSINSGISEDEVFDLTPHAMAITSKLIDEADSFTLPRKLKLAFSTSEDNTDYAAVNDLGFVAKIKDGKRGYKVYMGGSVASKPTVGWVLSDFVPEKDLFVIAEATKKLFSQHGNRKNKHKARLRYVFYKLGEAEVFRLFNEYLNEARHTTQDFILEEEKTTFVPKTYSGVATEHTEGFEEWKQRYTSSQKQNRYSTILIPFIHGNIRLDNTRLVDNLKTLLNFISLFGNDTIRFSTFQNVHLRNIPNEVLAQVYQIAKNIEANVDEALLINNIVSCTGADTCRLGIGLSKGLAAAIRKELQKSTLDLDKVAHLRIHISGCPNSCGQQVWADLGFSGKVLRNGRILPGYQIYAGASRSNRLELGQPIGSLNARSIPKLVVRLLDDYIHQLDKYNTFRDYINGKGKEYIEQLIAEYKDIPSFDEDKNYYFDWGADKLFSVAERGVGECSAGLFDMIDLDLKFIRESQNALEKEPDNAKINSLLYDILYSSCRMLLITRGAEPKSTVDTFDFFIQHFIHAGLVDKSYQEIVQIAKLDRKADFISQKSIIYRLAERVIGLYQNMDDSLQFKNIK